MRITRLLVLILSLKKLISASAQLVERQGQGLGAFPDFGDLLWGGLGAVLHGVPDLFQNPQESDPSKTLPPPIEDSTSDGETSPKSPEFTPASPPSSDTSPPTEPVYKININNNDPVPLPGIGSNPPAVLPSGNEECDPMKIVDADCGKTTDQLVFTSSCDVMDPNQVVSAEAKAQNQAIREALVAMNDQNILAGRGGRGLRTSKSRICDVYFFAVPLTAKQIEDIEENPGVRSVRPNRALHMDDVPRSSHLGDSDPAEMLAPNALGSRLEERDAIVEDSNAWEDLRFISTPRGSELSSAYFYYSKAGEGVTVIAVDSGVNILHDEFVTTTGQSSLLDADTIFAMDAIDLEEDWSELGTCRTSKIVGRTYGVARKAKVLVAKVSLELSSLVDVLAQITDYMYNRVLGHENAIGYHVLSFMVQWDNTDGEVTRRLEQLLGVLITFYKVVVVVQAGMDPSNLNSDINQWPATAERKHDIIVVGAINVRTGRSFSWSRGGPFLSVNAPGVVRCAHSDGRSVSMEAVGTDVATTQVAGLVAYLLAHEVYGPSLRMHLGMTVKQFIKTVASYKRVEDDFPAIWNLYGAPPPILGDQN